MRRAARPLLYAGIAVAVFGLAKVHARYIGEYDFTGSFRFAWTIAYVALLCVAAYGAGLPDLPRTGRQAVTSAIAAPVAAAVGISIVQLVTGDALLPRFVVLGSAGAVVVLSLFCARLAGGGRLRAESRDRVVLVSDQGEVSALRDELRGHPERPAVLVDHLTPAEALPKGTRSKPLTERVLAAGATVVVLDRAAVAEAAIVAQAAALHETGLRVRSLSLFYEHWLGKLPVSELERASLLFDIRELHGTRYLRVKRMLDVLAALVAVVLFALIVPAVMIGNLIGNRGPLFYRQPRVGKNHRVFTMMKFRTMTPDAGGLVNEWTREHDPRITAFGHLLRRTHLDELPQALNILRGDLSIVGPRPEQPQYVAELVEKLPFYDLRHLVRPGLTGWAQVKYGYAGDEGDALEKLQYEFWYLRHQSLALDIRIIGRTARSVFGRRGR